MTRVANLAQHQRNLAHILNAQARLTTGQIQISSGKVSPQYSGISRDARQLVNAEMSLARTAQFVTTNNTIDQRLQTMETNVSQIFNVLTEFKSLLVNGLNANNSADLAMPTQAQAMLNQVTALLNVEEDGRYLFAGSRTDTAPVVQSGLPVTYTIPTADDDANGYYVGDTVQFSVRADESFDLQYGINAGEQVGAVGTRCANNCHLHTAVSSAAYGTSVTIPTAFSHYELSENQGQSWQVIDYGIPQTGQWVRPLP